MKTWFTPPKVGGPLLQLPRNSGHLDRLLKKVFAFHHNSEASALRRDDVCDLDSCAVASCTIGTEPLWPGNGLIGPPPVPSISTPPTCQRQRIESGLTAEDSPGPVQVLDVGALESSRAADLRKSLSLLVPSFNSQATGGDLANNNLAAKLRGVSMPTCFATNLPTGINPTVFAD